ncbi:hypothetical protein [Falsiphaeobacter marinintestinus]|uniref:hypothetical protein n=1 Tax=Falsiphaeobacter marinintestinus TaxID=1492905 RepID=UPI0011B798B9|nr:hypothetical protein [Phaeobacter marinintestinus]
MKEHLENVVDSISNISRDVELIIANTARPDEEFVTTEFPQSERLFTESQLKKLLPNIKNPKALGAELGSLEREIIQEIWSASRVVDVGSINLLAYDELLHSGVDYLVRALAIRDDAMELSLRMFNDVLDRWIAAYEFVNSNAELAPDGPVEQQVKADLDFAKKMIDAAELFKNEGEKRKAIAEAERVSVLAATKRNSIEKSRKILKTRFDVALARNSQAEIPGSALNIGERISTLRASLKENLREAYRFLFLANEGLKIVYPKMFDQDGNEINFSMFPSLTDPQEGDEGTGYADKLLGWARQVSAAVDREQSGRIELRSIFAVAQTDSPNLLSEELKALNDGEIVRFSTVRDKSGELIEVFGGLRDVMLVSAKVFWWDTSIPPGSVSGSELSIAVHQLNNVMHGGRLTPPKMNHVDIDESRFSNDFMDAMSIYSPMREYDSTRQAFRNCNPEGEWSLKFNKQTNYPPTDFGGSHLTDYSLKMDAVFVEFVVTGIPVSH